MAGNLRPWIGNLYLNHCFLFYSFCLILCFPFLSLVFSFSFVSFRFLKTDPSFLYFSYLVDFFFQFSIPFLLSSPLHFLAYNVAFPCYIYFSYALTKLFLHLPLAIFYNLFSISLRLPFCYIFLPIPIFSLSYFTFICIFWLIVTHPIPFIIGPFAFLT